MRLQFTDAGSFKSVDIITAHLGLSVFISRIIKPEPVEGNKDILQKDGT